MLLLLTGDVQIGKTRWLSRAVEALTAASARCEGVLAPGVWERRADGTLDKLGIDNVLLPEGERIPFARRADLAQAEGTFDAGAQAARAGLGWHISDDALARVNAHFDALWEAGSNLSFGGASDESADDREDSGSPRTSPFRLLAVDELGQLELLRGEGLTSAVRLLDAGSRGVYEHAFVIVRDRFGLLEAAEQRFAPAWGGSVRISPDEDAWHQWVAPLCQ